MCNLSEPNFDHETTKVHFQKKKINLTNVLQIQLCWATESPVVLLVCPERSYQLLIYNLLCVLLRYVGRIHVIVFIGFGGSVLVLWTWLDLNMYFGE